MWAAAAAESVVTGEPLLYGLVDCKSQRISVKNEADKAFPQSLCGIYNMAYHAYCVERYEIRS